MPLAAETHGPVGLLPESAFPEKFRSGGQSSPKSRARRARLGKETGSYRYVPGSAQYFERPTAHTVLLGPKTVVFNQLVKKYNFFSKMALIFLSFTQKLFQIALIV